MLQRCQSNKRITATAERNQNAYLKENAFKQMWAIKQW